ncbi:MAG: RNA polymerase sigma factor RpoE [Gemmatimonadetes bacterium]|nr:RNA polymerase sigma factor RpoE [Gemmatimonadota bacterium]
MAAIAEMLPVKTDFDDFDALVSEYRPRVVRLAARFTDDADEAEDIAQETFFKAYRAKAGFQGDADIYTWLHRIALNCCKDWAKRAHRRLTESRDPGWWSQQDALGVGTGRIEPTDAGVERRDTSRALSDALTEIHPDLRRTFELAEFEELTYDEISRTLNCSVGTVKSRVFRARRRVRVALEARGIQ